MAQQSVPLYEHIPFKALLHEPAWHPFFLEFLSSCGQSHKFEFWLEAEKYESLAGRGGGGGGGGGGDPAGGARLRRAAAACYDRFLSPAAYPACHLPHALRAELEDLMAIGRPRLYLFSRAKFFISKELETDWYDKFLESTSYQDLLKKEVEGFSVKLLDVLEGGPYRAFFERFLATAPPEEEGAPPPPLPPGGEEGAALVSKRGEDNNGRDGEGRCPARGPAAFSFWLGLGHLVAAARSTAQEAGGPAEGGGGGAEAAAAGSTAGAVGATGAAAGAGAPPGGRAARPGRLWREAAEATLRTAGDLLGPYLPRPPPHAVVGGEVGGGGGGGEEPSGGGGGGGEEEGLLLPPGAVDAEALATLAGVLGEFKEVAAVGDRLRSAAFLEAQFPAFARALAPAYRRAHAWLDARLFPAFRASRPYALVAAHRRRRPTAGRALAAEQGLEEMAASLARSGLALRLSHPSPQHPLGTLLEVSAPRVRSAAAPPPMPEPSASLAAATAADSSPHQQPVGEGPAAAAAAAAANTVRLWALEGVVVPSGAEGARAGEESWGAGAEGARGGLWGAFRLPGGKAAQRFRVVAREITEVAVTLAGQAPAHPEHNPSDAQQAGALPAPPPPPMPHAFLEELAAHCFPTCVALVGGGGGGRGQQRRALSGDGGGGGGDARRHRRGGSQGPEAAASAPSLHQFAFPAPAEWWGVRGEGEGGERLVVGEAAAAGAAGGRLLYGCCLTTWAAAHAPVGLRTGRSAAARAPVALAAVGAAPLADGLRALLSSLAHRALGPAAAGGGRTHGSVMGLKIKNRYFPPQRGGGGLDDAGGAEAKKKSAAEREEVVGNPQADCNPSEEYRLAAPPLPFDRHTFRGLGPTPDLPLLTLFKVLSPPSVARALLALTLEYPVVVTSSVRSLTAAACEGLRALLFPLRWQGAYRPLLPPARLPAFWAQLLAAQGQGAARRRAGGGTAGPLRRRPAERASDSRRKGGGGEGQQRGRTLARRGSCQPDLAPTPLGSLPAVEAHQVLARKTELERLKAKNDYRDQELKSFETDRIGEEISAINEKGRSLSVSRPPHNLSQQQQLPPVRRLSLTLSPAPRQRASGFFSSTLPERRPPEENNSKDWLNKMFSRPSSKKRTKSPPHYLQQTAGAAAAAAGAVPPPPSGPPAGPRGLGLPERVEAAADRVVISCPSFLIGLESKVLEACKEYEEASTVSNPNDKTPQSYDNNGEVWGMSFASLACAVPTTQSSKLSYATVSIVKEMMEEAVVVDLDQDEVAGPRAGPRPPLPAQGLHAPPPGPSAPDSGGALAARRAADPPGAPPRGRGAADNDDVFFGSPPGSPREAGAGGGGGGGALPAVGWPVGAGAAAAGAAALGAAAVGSPARRLLLAAQRALHPDLGRADLLRPPSPLRGGGGDDDSGGGGDGGGGGGGGRDGDEEGEEGDPAGSPLRGLKARNNDGSTNGDTILINTYTPTEMEQQLRCAFTAFYEELLGDTSEFIMARPDLRTIYFDIAGFLTKKFGEKTSTQHTTNFFYSAGLKSLRYHAHRQHLSLVKKTSAAARRVNNNIIGEGGVPLSSATLQEDGNGDDIGNRSTAAAKSEASTRRGCDNVEEEDPIKVVGNDTDSKDQELNSNNSSRREEEGERDGSPATESSQDQMFWLLFLKTKAFAAFVAEEGLSPADCKKMLP